MVKDKIFNVHLTKEEHAKVKFFSAMEEKTMKDFLHSIIKESLDKLEQNKKY